MHHLLHAAVFLSGFFVLFLVLLIAVSVYFLPTFCAFLTHHRRRWIIAAINLFFGWSLIAWFITMIWVWTGPRDETPKSQYFG